MYRGLRIGVAGKTMAAATAALMLGLAAPAGAAECAGEYTIQSGDTLSRIASRCDSSVEALMDANPQITSPSKLSIGWKLVVPEQGADSGGTDEQVADSDGTSDGDGEQVAAIPEKDGPVLLEGWITNGRRCAMLATEDGEEYGVVSPEFSFISGRAVSVEGRLVDDPSCSGPRTVLVTELSTSEL